MLDTNTVSALARDPRGAVAGRIADVGPDAVCDSIVTAAELRFGCVKMRSPRLTAQIDAILGAIAIQALDVPADAEYGRLRAELESAGAPIGPNDLPIRSRSGRRW